MQAGVALHRGSVSGVVIINFSILGFCAYLLKYLSSDHFGI